MKVGDLVMWLGKDEWHGMIGVIAKAVIKHGEWLYEVQWSDGVRSCLGLLAGEIMAVEDEEGQQS